MAQNDEGVVGEDDTLTVANSANASVTGSYDAAGEHSGDVIDTSSSSHTDSDADDSASLSISAIRTGQGKWIWNIRHSWCSFNRNIWTINFER